MASVTEVIVIRELSGDQVFTDAIITDINPKLASSILTQLSKQLPLQSFNLDHLKRVRRVPNAPGEPAVEFTDKVTGAVSKYAFRLQVILCPPRALASLQTEVRQILGYSDSADMELPVETIQVCRVAPECKEELEAWNGYWPTLFRPDNLSREREKGTHTGAHLQLIAQYIRRAVSDGELCRRLAGKEAAVAEVDQELFCGACIVNPVNHKIVASSAEWYERVCSAAEGGDSLQLRSPLMSPTLRCIDMVAAVVRGDHLPVPVPIDIPDSLLDLLDSYKPKRGEQGSSGAGAGAAAEGGDVLGDDHYLCSGLDLFLQREPDVMSCMALVHSRIRRVYYKDSCEFGALGTHTHMHGMRQLNHRYRAFRCELAPPAAVGAGGEDAALKEE